VILGAGLLLLVGLGLLIGGVVTGLTALYWACVGVCLVAAVLLFVVRRQMAAAPAPSTGEPPAGRPAEPVEVESLRAEPAVAEPAVVEPVEAEPAVPERASRGSHAAPEEPVAETPVPPSEPEEPPAPAATGAAPRGPRHDDHGEPPLEEVEVTDLLLVVDLHDEVLVIDEHPRYHLSGCAHLTGRTAVPLPIDEARADGFTPCGSCRPDRHLADQVRARRSAPDH
jgi:hypothetical protein